MKNSTFSQDRRKAAPGSIPCGPGQFVFLTLSLGLTSGCTAAFNDTEMRKILSTTSTTSADSSSPTDGTTGSASDSSSTGSTDGEYTSGDSSTGTTSGSSTGGTTSSTGGGTRTPLSIASPSNLSLSSLHPVSIALSADGEEDFAGHSCDEIVVIAVADHPELFDDGSFALTGTFPNCSLEINPAPGTCGSSQVTLSISIPGGTSDGISFEYTSTGEPYVISIENAPSGIGTPLSGAFSESADGATLHAYSVLRNQCGDFVEDRSVDWNLVSSDTGASLDSDFVSSTSITMTTAFSGPRATASLSLSASHADYGSVSTALTYQFTNSGLQLWLDAQKSDTLFQNTAGTTAASSTGEEIQLWKDRSGKARDAVQWSATRTPTLDASTSHPTVNFTKDCLKLGADGEDFDILDTDAFTLAFVVSRASNNTASWMKNTASYPAGTYMPLFSTQDFTTAPAEGMIRIVANNAYAIASQYRTDRNVAGQYWFSANSILNNGNQPFGNSGSASPYTNTTAYEGKQVLLIRANASGIQQQILRTGTITTSDLKVTALPSGGTITGMQHTASATFPALLGCDYDQSAGAEYDGAYGSGGSTTGHFPYTGSFGEVIIYNRYLSDTEAVTLINALSSRWGL